MREQSAIGNYPSNKIGAGAEGQMRSSFSTSVVSALAALSLFAPGCTAASPGPDSAREAAAVVLNDAIGDSTQVVGYTIGADVVLLEGREVRQRRLFPVEQTRGEAIQSAEGGPAVLGRDFDLAGSLARADAQLERCGDGGRVQVRVLSREATLTVTDCDEASQLLLNDTQLRPLEEQIESALEGMIGELEAAGLADSVTSITFDKANDDITVSYLGEDLTREYSWVRGWRTPSSLVISSDISPGERVRMRPAALRAAPDRVAAELAGSPSPDLLLLQAGPQGETVELRAG